MKKRRNHSNAQLDRILMDIRGLMQQNKSSVEIMDLLGIPLRSYRRYSSTIHKQEKTVWNEIVENEIYTHLLKVKESFFHTYRTALALSEDPEYKDRLTALQIKDNAILTLTQILLSPPELVTDDDKSDDTPAVETTKIDYAALAKQQYQQYNKQKQHHP